MCEEEEQTGNEGLGRDGNRGWKSRAILITDGEQHLGDDLSESGVDKVQMSAQMSK